MTTKIDNAEIVHLKSGGTVFAGRDAVNYFQAVSLAAYLRLYAKSGIRPSRHVSPSDMLKMATSYTGKTYKRGAYEQAASDVTVWAQTMRAGLPEEMQS